MAGFLNKLRSASTGAVNAANNASLKTKKDEPAQELTPLEKMLQNAGPIREDGSDKFFGLENFGNTCYCNSIVQALYYSEQFRDHVVKYPPFTPSDTPNGQPRKVNVSIRPPMNGSANSPNGKQKSMTTGQAMKQRQAINSGQVPPGQQRPEDRPDSPEYKKKQAMIKGPVLELAQENVGAYGMDECTFTGLKDIFMALIESNTRTGILSPQRFLEIFKRDNEMFRNSMHQDAHEFYGLVLNDIISNVEANGKRIQGHGELSKQNGLSRSVENALSASSVVRQSAQSSGAMSPGTGWVHDIFEGVLVSETKCLTCEVASQRDETFLDLSIDLEEHSSVTSCLRSFSAEEMLCERNKFHCDRCGGLQEAEKRMKIKKLPKVLALHLKRFKYTEDYSRLQKLFHRIVYPYHLRMFNTTDDADDPDRLYELYAVVVHIGANAYHGHYVSVIKTPDRGWLLFDDEMVEPVDKHFVRNFFGDKPGMACAYVLFYQETTFAKVLAEQEAEGLEEVRIVSETADLSLNAVKTNGEPTTPLTKQHTSPISPPVSPIEERASFSGLSHARTAPMTLNAHPVPPIPEKIPESSSPSPVNHQLAATPPPASAVVSKKEKEKEKEQLAKQTKEEKKKEKKEQKAAEKARKVAEKEHAKQEEKQRHEKYNRMREARKNEADELQKALAASKASAADEEKKRKKETAAEPGASSPMHASHSFLNRANRGSKSLSRKSIGWLGRKGKEEEREKGKDKDKDKDKEVDNHKEEHHTNHAESSENGEGRSSTTVDRTPALKERFSFGGIGRKRSNIFS